MRSAAVLGIVALVLGGLGCLACSLAIDASDIDEQCPSQWKACNGRCVKQDDPEFGCGPTCRDACTLENATVKCLETECVVEKCAYGFAYEDITKGCPNNYLADPDHCGQRGEQCQPARPICIDGVCSPR